MIYETLGALAETCRQARQSGKTIVFLNGCFDLFHAGHLHVIKQAVKNEPNPFVVVAVNSDRTVKKLKGKGRPIVSERSRMAVVDAVREVDAVIKFDELTPALVIVAVSPDIIVKGSDWDPQDVVGAEIAVVKSVKQLAGWSTTAIINRITEARHGVRVPLGGGRPEPDKAEEPES